jgi:hypothetical protein
MGIPTAILDPKRSSVAAPLWCRLEGLLLAEPREPLDQELKIGLYGTVSDVFWITLRRHYGVVIVWHRSDRARSWFMVGYDERRWSKTLPVNANQFLGVTDSPPPGSGRHHVRIMASADRTDTLDHWRTLVSGRIGFHFCGCGFTFSGAPMHY